MVHACCAVDVDLAAAAGEAGRHLLRSGRQLQAQAEGVEVPDPVSHVRDVAALGGPADDGLDVQLEPLLRETPEGPRESDRI